MSGQTVTTTAARELQACMPGLNHDVAIVLGSGWLEAANELGSPDFEFAISDFAGFNSPVVAGHGATIRSVEVGDHRALVFLGRTHFYENRDTDAVAHAVRVAAAVGVSTVILTNGCGGLNPAWKPGTPVLMSDHINLTGASPLSGAQFVDLTDLYSPRLRALAREIKPDLPEGVYAQLPGPHYETPAEIRMLRNLGADLVGMSTALEAIAARALGLEVLGISLVTNQAAGMSGEPLNHDEVLAAGKSTAQEMGQLVRHIVERLPRS